jgi:hypothetical protein
MEIHLALAHLGALYDAEVSPQFRRGGASAVAPRITDDAVSEVAFGRL